MALGLVLHARCPARLVAASSRPLGGLVVAAGGCLIAWAVATLLTAGTDPRPDRPTTTLVTHGPYRHTRNPIYLGLTTMYIGLLLLAGTAWPALFLPTVLAIMHEGVIAREERYLARRFGSAFTDYAARVPRWL